MKTCHTRISVVYKLLQNYDWFNLSFSLCIKREVIYCTQKQIFGSMAAKHVQMMKTVLHAQVTRNDKYFENQTGVLL